MYFIHYKKPVIRILIFVFVILLYSCSGPSDTNDEINNIFEKLRDLSAPQQLQYDNLEENSVSILWEQVDRAGFYKVYLNGEILDTVYDITSYVYANLLPESTHLFSVQACNTLSCSELSDELEVVTDGTDGNPPPDTGVDTIITEGIIPDDFSQYTIMEQEIFRYYESGSTIQIRYVTEDGSGTGDGSSWDNAANDIKTVLESINDASATNIYMVAVATGTYTIIETLSMKNGVAIVGGLETGTLAPSSTSATILDGNNTQRIFSNTEIDNTAVLFGVRIINGFAQNHGGAMYNLSSSPIITRVMFTGNTSESFAGAMYNESSFPILTNVTFDSNVAETGGAMFNFLTSHPRLFRVTFHNNTAKQGGAISNYKFSAPFLFNVTFTNNTATELGGAIMSNNDYANTNPIIINALFWGNSDSEGKSIHIANEESMDVEKLLIYNSILESGIGNDENNNALVSGNTVTGLRDGGLSSKASGNIAISFQDIIEDDPLVGDLSNDGVRIETVLINEGSSAIDKGWYVRTRKSDSSLYFSEDNIVWYRGIDANGLTGEVELPDNAIDPIAIDAAGNIVNDAPDIGAHEF